MNGAPKKLKDFIEIHCRARHYSYQIRKCSSEECWYCTLSPKRTTDDVTLNWLPDPTKGQDGEYLPLEDIIGTETTDKDRPGSQAKGTPTDSDKKNKGILIGAKVRSFIICCQCGKRRVVYCKERLCRQQMNDIEEAQDQQLYTCGSTLFPPGHRNHDLILVKEGLECATEMETTYYAGITVKFQSICFYCGDLDILDNTEKVVADLLKQYSIVRPICQGCVDNGKQPAVRNAMKTKK